MSERDRWTEWERGEEERTGEKKRDYQRKST